MDDNFDGISLRLHALRVSRNEDIDRIAALCGINRAWYFDLEADDYELSCNVPVRCVVLICVLLNTTTNALVLGKNYNGDAAITPSQLRDTFLSRSEEDQTRIKENLSGYGCDVDAFISDFYGIYDWHTEFLSRFSLALGAPFDQILAGL